MLKDNEKRIFWIVVMAVAAVSLITAWVSGIVLAVDDMINSAHALGEYSDVDFRFGIAVVLLALLAVVAAAAAHLCTKGRNSAKAKLVWAIVIGVYFLLSCIVFAIVYYTKDIGSYNDFMEYVTVALAIAVSYEIAFAAQRMLDKRNVDQ